MKQKLIEWIHESGKNSFTKEELLEVLNSFDNSEDGYTVIDEEYSVEYEDKKQILPRKEFELVKLLMENKGRVLGKKEILKKVWEQNVIVGERTIDVHICKIKRKFPDIPIQTRKCYGYLWK